MNKFSERLMEKRIVPMIKRKCNGIMEEKFIQCFNNSCINKPINDTTIGHTFRELEKIVLREVEEDYLHMKNNTLIKSMDDEFDSLTDLLIDMMEEFEYYMDFKGWIESILSDEFQDKKEELLKNGIIDQNGDFMNENIKND